MLIELPPESCSSGHPFKSGSYQVGFLHCQCEGTDAGIPAHRQYECLSCGERLIPGWHVCASNEEWRKHGAYTAVRAKPDAERESVAVCLGVTRPWAGGSPLPVELLGRGRVVYPA